MGATNSLGALAVSVGGAPLRASGWVPEAPPVGGGRCRSMWGVFGLQVRGICSQKLVYKKVFGIHL